MWRRSLVNLSPALRLASQRITQHHVHQSSPPFLRTLCESPRSKPSTLDPGRRTLSQDIKEYGEAKKTGSTARYDDNVLPAETACIFPRIKTTSLSTKRIVIHDKAHKKDLTLVLVAFRSFADEQLASWRTVLESIPNAETQWYDVTINESFGAQALSGFVQRWQRSRTDAALHDYYVAFNSKAREPLETLLLSNNRMYGYALLLDRDAKVRFRALGTADERGKAALISSAEQILREYAAAPKKQNA